MEHVRFKCKIKQTGFQVEKFLLKGIKIFEFYIFTFFYLSTFLRAKALAMHVPAKIRLILKTALSPQNVVHSGNSDYKQTNKLFSRKFLIHYIATYVIKFIAQYPYKTSILTKYHSMGKQIPICPLGWSLKMVEYHSLAS